jgi:hypothetical protein
MATITRLPVAYQSESELSEGSATAGKDPALWQAGVVLTRPFASEETVLPANQATREAVSLAGRPVVLELTDEQAEQLLEFQGRHSAP